MLELMADRSRARREADVSRRVIGSVPYGAIRPRWSARVSVAFGFAALVDDHLGVHFPDGITWR
jgi:hypothetical protein